MERYIMFLRKKNKQATNFINSLNDHIEQKKIETGNYPEEFYYLPSAIVQTKNHEVHRLRVQSADGRRRNHLVASSHSGKFNEKGFSMNFHEFNSIGKLLEIDGNKIPYITDQNNYKRFPFYVSDSVKYADSKFAVKEVTVYYDAEDLTGTYEVDILPGWHDEIIPKKLLTYDGWGLSNVDVVLFEL